METGLWLSGLPRRAFQTPGYDSSHSDIWLSAGTAAASAIMPAKDFEMPAVASPAVTPFASWRRFIGSIAPVSSKAKL
jgi:hypothetical protein